ncbi:MAG: phenylalanine--tRNA ligase subunit beta [Chromatiaceae bacterium]|nr:phenylalanine--tRNA ligase subunit beta [Chromatiaceae bacterium]MCP5445891.1 phenylalanine--tRNA ligase subunit beta [Chromatiaceae bacterium]
MKFSEAWLRTWVDPAVGTDELADQLSMAGLEVDSVTPVAGEFNGVVVGQVLTREQHPNADKLSLCSVATGEDEPLQIICGAANVATGMKVPVAKIGAVLPGDLKIKRAKLRGVESQGMICSAAELGLADSSSGIMPLPSDAPLGLDFRSYLGLDDHAIDVDLTPDRGDCLGLAGIAREVGVINRVPVTAPAMHPVDPMHTEQFAVDLIAPESCPRYTCRIIRNIDPAAKTPLWMKERLRRGDLRSIHPVVDVTNYVMLELGQPMHGFDLRQLSGGIRVRMAAAGEKLRMLDGSDLELRDDTLVIADHEKVVALAGIMGGEYSGVAGDTCDVLLECAFFSPTSIIGKARSYGLHTDSSHRYERGVDPMLQVTAMERATRLLLDITGGEPGPINEVAFPQYIEQRPEILLRRSQVKRLLGMLIDDEIIVDILKRLEMRVEAASGGWKVIAPSCRFDISIEADLIEEIGRIYGYTKIPMHRSAAATLMQGTPEVAFSLERAKQILVDRDYQEAITYSFISPEMHDLMDPEHGTVKLANPISTDMSIMRTSLWPGLLQTALYNQARQYNRIRIFESGLRFIKQDGEIKQDLMLSGLITGTQEAEQWGGPTRMIDFFDLKADLQAVLSLTARGDALSFTAETHPSLHPGQSASITIGDAPIGWIGMLHPEIEKRLGLTGKVFLFEIRLGSELDGSLPSFRELSRFPSIRRDIAVVVDEKVRFSELRDTIRKAAPGILKDLTLFDVYMGERIDSGLKSLALGLILQETSHTLTDTEVEGVMDRILLTLKQELNAQLRV